MSRFQMPGILASGTVTDPYFSSVKALLHMDGANGGTTFTDVTGKTVTAFGGAVTSTTHPKFGTASAKFVSGSSDYLYFAPTTDFAFGTGDFTIEFWTYLDAAPTFGAYFCDFRDGNSNAIALRVTSAGDIAFQSFAITHTTGSGGLFNTTGVHRHVALSRISATSRLYVAGTQVGSDYADTDNYDVLSGLQIGRSKFGNTYYDGWIDDFRVTKGVGRYSGASFIPPTAAFPDM